MSRSISREEAQAYKSRWKLVREFERKELRETPPEEKFRQLEALAGLPGTLGKDGRRDGEKARIRNRWNRLRKILSA